LHSFPRFIDITSRLFAPCNLLVLALTDLILA